MLPAELLLASITFCLPVSANCRVDWGNDGAGIIENNGLLIRLPNEGVVNVVGVIMVEGTEEISDVLDRRDLVLK